MAKARAKRGQRCPKPLKCPTPMAVASRAGTQAKTCAGKRRALDMWLEVASAEVMKNPAKERHINRLFDKKAASVERQCRAMSDRARQEARRIEAERERIVSHQPMDGFGRLYRR